MSFTEHSTTHARSVSGRSSRARGPEVLDCDSDHLRELLELLMKKKVPEKREIIRVKQLVHELASGGSLDAERKVSPDEFISAYLDLYLGRVIGDERIEKAGLRRCVECLSAHRRIA